MFRLMDKCEVEGWQLAQPSTDLVINVSIITSKHLMLKLATCIVRLRLESSKRDELHVISATVDQEELLGAGILQDTVSPTHVHVLNLRASCQLVQAPVSTTSKLVVVWALDLWKRAPHWSFKVMDRVAPACSTTSSMLFKLLLPFQNETFKWETKKITEL